MLKHGHFSTVCHSPLDITLARVVDSFIRMEEDYELDESKRIDAEAVFNDYYMACRDLEDGNDSEPTLNEEGN